MLVPRVDTYLNYALKFVPQADVRSDDRGGQKTGPFRPIHWSWYLDVHTWCTSQLTTFYTSVNLYSFPTDNAFRFLDHFQCRHKIFNT